jgi:hypothetical protein
MWWVRIAHPTFAACLRALVLAEDVDVDLAVAQMDCEEHCSVQRHQPNAANRNILNLEKY